MNTFIVVLLILISYMLDAVADAVDHAKGARYLYEFWHLVKALSNGILVVLVLCLIHLPFLFWPIVGILMWVLWEIVYNTCRALEVYRLDDKIEIPIIRKLWGISNTGRERMNTSNIDRRDIIGKYATGKWKEWKSSNESAKTGQKILVLFEDGYMDIYRWDSENEWWVNMNDVYFTDGDMSYFDVIAWAEINVGR